jgi:hypothetical protein
MPIAVVTAYHEEPMDWLLQCNRSVLAQSIPCEHIVVSDGVRLDPPAGFQGQVLQLPYNHANYGNTPRARGARHAIENGFDAICWLDADNWFAPEHVAELVGADDSFDLAVSGRTIVDIDGSSPRVCPHAGPHLFDANCLLARARGLEIAEFWENVPIEYAYFSDRFLEVLAIRKQLVVRRTNQPTVFYRDKRAAGDPERRGLAPLLAFWNQKSAAQREALLKEWALI